MRPPPLRNKVNHRFTHHVGVYSCSSPQSKKNCINSENGTKSFSINISARTQYTILDPVADGPVVSPNGLRMLVVHTASDIANVFSGDMNNKLKFLARYGLIANEKRCTDAACTPNNERLALVKDDEDPDKYRVSVMKLYLTLCTPCYSNYVYEQSPGPSSMQRALTMYC